MRSGKPITEVSKEEVILFAAPFIIGTCVGVVISAVWGDAVGATVGVLIGACGFALVWPRLCELGFELEEPRW